MSIIHSESSELTDESLEWLVGRHITLEQELIEGLTKKVLNNWGYPPELEFFIQPYKAGKRQGFYRWSVSKVLDESDVVCHIYSYYSEKDMGYIFEEYWNVK